MEDLKRIWKNFKEHLSKCLKKCDLMTRSGASASALPECKLFHQLLFLRDKVTNRKTESNQSQGMLGPPESSEPFSQSSPTFVVAPLSPLNSTATPTLSQSGEPGCSQISKRKRKATATATTSPSSLKEKMMITDKSTLKMFYFEP